MNLREIDRLAAEEIMGLKLEAFEGGSLHWFEPEAEGGQGLWHSCPRYSSDIATAWKLVERLDLFARHAIHRASGMYGVYPVGVLGDLEGCIGIADTAPLAICLAALEMKGVEVPK